MRRATGLLAAALLAALSLAPSARAAFGVNGFDVAFAGTGGEALSQAGAHPFAMTTTLNFNSHPTAAGGEAPDEAPRNLIVTQVPGFAGDPTAAPRCSAADFLTEVDFGGTVPDCPNSTAVGTVFVTLSIAAAVEPKYGAVYNLVPSPGEVAKLGFEIGGSRVVIGVGLGEQPPYRVEARLTNITQTIAVLDSQLTLWGVPADPAHDPLRGHCIEPGTGGSFGNCPAGVAERAFLTLPRACRGPLATSYAALSWPGSTDSGGALTHDGAGQPQGFTRCDKLGFSPSITSKPTTLAAQSPSGLDFSLEVEDEGFSSPEGLAGSDIEKTEVTLPEGMSINPSQAEGLEVCTEADLARERPDSAPGEGCPQASKVGTIEVETPELPEAVLHGALYVAEPYANPTGSLIAVYVVISDAELGVKIVQPIEVSPDPRTGRLVATASDIPQHPFSAFRLHFREGARAPLISPPGCGSFDTVAKLYPYSGAPPVTSTSAFEIVSGPNSSPCPSGAAPFAPGFSAGTLNNAAGSYSPFVMRITRQDAEQDISRFSAILPRGVVGRIAGIPWCPEAGIAQARARSGPHGGQEELDRPSCPAASQIGRTLTGAGVGSALTYVPGSLYLAGPYHGAPLSVVAITPAVAGPFDAGTVVVREALGLNPITAEVAVDGRASDPIPHILKGIPLNVRDLRVFADRPGFTLNATSCEPSLAQATIWGAGTVLAPTGEAPVGAGARYQAAGCASLGFKPKLAIKLRGGTRRGAHPALRAVLTPRPGDANFSGAVVRLPHSAFLDQAHIRTVCTRVQFAAGPGNGAACPPGARYGYARVWTPLLAQPLQGPVFLRSSSHKLPDLVLALHGQFDIILGARIDSKRGGIRTSFADVPDAPVSRFILDMQGGRKGLVINSTGLCRDQKQNRARASLRAQSGKRRTLRPVVRAVRCKKGGSAKKGRGGEGNRQRSRHGRS